MKRTLLASVILIFCFAFSHSQSTQQTAGNSSKKPTVIYTENVPSRTNDSGNAVVKMLLNRDQTGDPQFYLGHARFAPGASVAEHVHENSVEIVYTISGAGTFVMSGKQYEVKSGTALYIPENTPHSFTNSGKESVEIIQVYSPAGPEDRFNAWK